MCSLYLFDMLGSFTGIRIKGHHRMQSNLGGFFSIISFIVAIVTISFFGNMYLSKSEVSQIHNILKFWNSQNITITNNLKFAISNKYLGKINMKEDFWKLNAYYVNFDVKHHLFNKTKLEAVTCVKENWLNVEDQFDFLELNKALCYDAEGYELSGNSNTEFYKYIAIEYSLKLDLKDIDGEFNEKLSHDIASNMPVSNLYFREGIFKIDGSNTDPNYYINSININNTFNNVKELNIAISNDELIVNEDKIFFSNPITKTAYVVSSSEEKISVRTPYQTNSLTIKLKASKQKSILNVSFMTFSETLARIGGIIQNLVTLFFLLNYIKGYWNYELDLYNNIFTKIDKDNTNRLAYTAYSDAFWNKENKFSICKNSSKIIQISHINSNVFNDKDNNLLESEVNNNVNIIKDEGKTVFSNNILKKLFPPHISNNIYNNNKNTSNNYGLVDQNSNSKIELRSNKSKSINKEVAHNINSNSKFINSNYNIKDNNKEREHISNDQFIKNKSAISIIKDNNEISNIISSNSISPNQVLRNIRKINNNNNNKSSELNENELININNNPININNKKLLSVNNSFNKNSFTKKQSLQINNEELINSKKYLNKKHSNQLDYFIIIEEIKHLYETINMTISEYVCLKYLTKCSNSKVCCKKALKKRKLFNLANHYLNDALEVGNLEKNYFDINMLKYLCLDEEQINLFDNLPLISSFSIIQDNKNARNKDTNDLFQNNNIKKYTEMSSFDKKLYGLFLGYYE